MKTNPSDWIEWDKNEALPFDGRVSVTVRSETPVVVKTSYGLVVGAGEYECESEVTGDGELMFYSDSPVFIKPSSRVQDRLQTSDEVFTSLDRPAPLTPEMLAIQRMLRRNEIQREADRQEMEQRYDRRTAELLRRQSQRDAPETPTAAEDAVVENVSRSEDDSSEQDSDHSGEDAVAAGNAGTGKD